MRLLAEIGPLTIGAIGWLMAQASGLDPTLGNLIGNGVTVALLAWYVVYDVRIRTPKMLNAFAREQTELRESFGKEQAESRETFKSEQRESRQNFSVLMDSVMKAEKEDRMKMREAHAIEISEWRKMVNDQIQAFRVAVHDVRDTAQAVVGQTELIVKKAGA